MELMNLFDKKSYNVDTSYDTIIEKLYKECLELSDKNNWEVPQFSKSQINKAGLTIANSDSTKDEYDKAIEIMNNWRAAHAYPLQNIYSRLSDMFKDFIVVQRLKRQESIVGKIKRFPEMNLYRMQDLDGCRIIVDSLDQVYSTVDLIKKSFSDYEIRKETDYIQKPKKSGYRCYHMICKFNSEDKPVYNKNMLIEIQVRTKMQHMWATAVEMMGLFTKSNLKSSQGDEDILRFFVVVSSIFAIYEKTPICPETSENLMELLEELDRLNSKHRILTTLGGLNTVTAHITNKQLIDENGNSLYYVLGLDYEHGKIGIKPFRKDEIEAATRFYNEVEVKAGKLQNVVLVSANSFKELKEAYPNYFADISKFINQLNKVLSRFK